MCVADVGVRPGGRARLVMHATSISQHQNSELHQRLARMTAYERIGRCVMLTGTPQGGGETSILGGMHHANENTMRGIDFSSPGLLHWELSSAVVKRGTNWGSAAEASEVRSMVLLIVAN